MANDDTSIQKYFEMYQNVDFNDDSTRNCILEYFVDKIYVYPDRLVTTFWYSDDKFEVPIQDIEEATRECSITSCLAPLWGMFENAMFSAFFFIYRVDDYWDSTYCNFYVQINCD
jgi:hypothetical protein